MNEVFRGANGVLSLAGRLVDVAETLPQADQAVRSELLKIAQELGKSANLIMRGQDHAVDAISRKLVL